MDPIFSKVETFNPEQKRSLLDFVSPFVTDSRKEQAEKVLENRTRFITVVLEDIYQPHNASAVVRSCEGFGIQDLHIIEERNRYRVNPDVTLGSSKWVTLKRYSAEAGKNTARCLNKLKKEGYVIAAATLKGNSIPLAEIPIDKKIAVCFGNEEEGLTETAHELADIRMHIPMFGFTQSFNISVSAAVTLYALTGRLRNNGAEWHLKNEEKDELRLIWYLRSLKNPEKYLNAFISSL
jgi:tRNA (guanosine-2'-O-)-methyltransferase